MDEEKFAVVSKVDNTIFSVYGKEALHTGRNFHRSIHIIIETHGGGIILQKKADGTENAGKWSSSVSGHVRYNETYRQAAVREAKEELGIEIELEEIYEISKIHPCANNGYEFMMVYSYLINPNEETIIPNPDEIDSVIIAQLSSVTEDINENRSSYSESFIMALDVLLTMFLPHEGEIKRR